MRKGAFCSVYRKPKPCAAVAAMCAGGKIQKYKKKKRSKHFVSFAEMRQGVSEEVCSEPLWSCRLPLGVSCVLLLTCLPPFLPVLSTTAEMTVEKRQSFSPPTLPSKHKRATSASPSIFELPEQVTEWWGGKKKREDMCFCCAVQKNNKKKPNSATTFWTGTFSMLCIVLFFFFCFFSNSHNTKWWQVPDTTTTNV